MKRIGILGGTFNPIHIGHLAVAEIVYEKLALDSVLFVPSYYPPHKGRASVINEKHRYKMVQLAIKKNPHFQALDFEIKRPGKSYSIDTVEHLYRAYHPAKVKFYFIIGSDMLPGLKKWKRIDVLAQRVQFVVVSRKGYRRQKSRYPIRRLTMPELGVSSSYLRLCLKRKKSVKYLLPDAVLAYIKKHKLYTS